VDVGGSTRGTQTTYFAYGYTGQNRPLIEGINTTEGTSAAGFYLDYGSFEEVFIGAAGNSAEMPNPGVLTQFVGKSGSIRTREKFRGDYHLHLEWATPAAVSGNGQGRGNSGVFIGGFPEIQVLDSYQNDTYPDGQAAAMYGQYPPLVNAARAPGQWQAYDIIFSAPRFAGDGKLEKPAIVTVLHNGVVVHHATPFWGPTRHKSGLPYKPEMAKGPLVLQDHGNPVRYLNIGNREKKG
jgi:hypothetical protein